MKRFWGFITPIFVIALVTGATTPQMASANDAISARVQELEQQIEQLKATLEGIKTQANQPSPEVQDLSNRVTRVEQTTEAQPATPVSSLEERIARVERVKRDKHSTVYFRGGYTELINNRGNQVFSDSFDFAGNTNSGDNGWYVGAGIEHTLVEDIWGMAPGFDLLAEIMFEWKRFESRDDSFRVVPTAVATLPDADDPTGGPVPDVLDGSTSVDTAATELQGITLSTFTLTASPKLKMPEFYGLRPWVIPAGLAFHVLSPPSNAGTVITPGVMFGGGVDYNIWQNVVVGFDGRYHLAADELDGVDLDHWTLGGYLGFQF